MLPTLFTPAAPFLLHDDMWCDGCDWNALLPQARDQLGELDRRWRAARDEAEGELLHASDLIAWGQQFLPLHFRQTPSTMHREVAQLLDAASVVRGSPDPAHGHDRRSPSATPSSDSGDLRSAEWPGQETGPQQNETGPQQGSDPQTDATPNLTSSPFHLFTCSSTPQTPVANAPGSPTSPDNQTTSPPDTPLKLNLLAPRASAKSTLVTLAYVLREALLGRQPYIWIVSDTKHQALAHLRNIAEELRDNVQLSETFRRARGFVFTGNRITMEGVVIEAYGTGQRLRGRRFRQHRPTLIVCDDLQNDNHIRSAKQRDISRTWFHGMLMKAGTKRTQFVNLGTALHREAIAIELHQSPGWTSRRYQAIQAWPTNMHLWSEWEELYRSAECGVGSAESDGGDQESGVRQQESGVSSNVDAHSALRTPHSELPSVVRGSPPVVRGSPDPAHGHDRRSPSATPSCDSGDLRSAEWPGRETGPQQYETGPQQSRACQQAEEPASRKRQRPEEPAAPSTTQTPVANAPGSPVSLNTNSPVTSSPLHIFTRSSTHHAAREYFQQRRHPMETGAKLLWPEEEDLYTLMCMRAESGPAAFEREKQCVPMNADDCEWPETYFNGDIWFTDWPKDLRFTTLALDPSKGSDARRGDYSAFVALGLGHDGLLYVDANLARRPTPQMVTDGVELVRLFKPQLFGIETNQFQALLGGEFIAALRKQGVVGTVPCSLENTLAKVVRIRRLGPLLAHRRFRFKSKSPGTKMLLDQLREFPQAAHDDGPDALEMALRLAESLAQPPPSDGLGRRLV